jgi:hypothetical protein
MENYFLNNRNLEEHFHPPLLLTLDGRRAVFSVLLRSLLFLGFGLSLGRCRLPFFGRRFILFKIEKNRLLEIFPLFVLKEFSFY